MLGLDAEVADLDRRLEALLIARDQRVWETSAPDPFWDFGYPSATGVRLIQDLINEGLAPNIRNVNRHYKDWSVTLPRMSHLGHLRLLESEASISCARSPPSSSGR